MNNEQIYQDIEEKLGFIPPYFTSAQENPQILENLWQQTLSAYLDNALPHLFKEKLFTYLSRYCSNPYWLLCKSCSLYSLGIKPQEILELLSTPAPTVSEIEQRLKAIAQQSEIENLSKLNPELEKTLLACGTVIFLQPHHTKSCCQRLKELLGNSSYQNLITLLSYIKTCHHWLEAYPEITPQNDPQVQNYLSFLLKEEPSLSSFFEGYNETIRLESQNREEQLCAEIAEYKRKEEEAQLLQTMAQEINESQNFHSALRVTLQKVCEVAGWNFGEAWIPDTEENILKCSPAWYSSDSHLKCFRELSESFEFSLGVGLPGRVWASKQIEWDRDVSTMPENLYLRASIAKEAGLKTGIGIPLLANGDVLAIMVFYMFEARDEDEQVVELISALTTLGATIQRKRAEETLQKALDTLEIRVQQRTEELTKANSKQCQYWHW